jgi:Glu-tRNA(Gln) amidotransferase subunit E-like FAD-binding protein
MSDGAIMGKIMRQFAGKVDGRKVMELLRKYKR